STNFTAVNFSGTFDIERNTLTRTGGWENEWVPAGEHFGAIWIYLVKAPINANIIIKHNIVNDSTYAGFEVQGTNSISGLVVDDLTINKTGTFGLELRDNPQGSGMFSNVVVTNAPSGGLGTNGLTGF